MRDIDTMVDDNQSKVIKLIEEAERIEKKMLEEERKRALAASIKKLTKSRLTYSDAVARKRRQSFKGRIQPTLFKGGIEQEEVSQAIDRGKPARPQSRTIARGNANRKVMAEKNITWAFGFDPDAIN